MQVFNEFYFIFCYHLYYLGGIINMFKVATVGFQMECVKIENIQDDMVINDPLCQTPILANSKHYFQIKIWLVFESEERPTDERLDGHV